MDRFRTPRLGDKDDLPPTPMDKEQRDRTFHFTPLMDIVNIQSPKLFHFDVAGKHRKFIEFRVHAHASRSCLSIF
jgi:hypothetical protein